MNQTVNFKNKENNIKLILRWEKIYEDSSCYSNF